MAPPRRTSAARLGARIGAKKPTAGGLDFDDRLERKDIGTTAAKNERQHGADGKPLRDGLDEHAAGQGHGAAEDGPVVIDAVHLGLLERGRRIDDAGRGSRHGECLIAAVFGIGRRLLVFVQRRATTCYHGQGVGGAGPFLLATGTYKYVPLLGRCLGTREGTVTRGVCRWHETDSVPGREVAKRRADRPLQAVRICLDVRLRKGRGGAKAENE
jgi:hypothetical protein